MSLAMAIGAIVAAVLAGLCIAEGSHWIGATWEQMTSGDDADADR